MPLVASVDYPNKLIYLGVDSVGVPLDTMDVYREVRERRRLTEGDRRYLVMIIGGGGIPKTPGVFTQPYVQLLYGCRIVPYDTPHSLVVIRDTFTDDGESGVECFDRSSVSSEVDIDIQVSPVEVREIATGGSALTVEQETWLREIFELHALDPLKPLSVSSSARSVGSVSQTISSGAARAASEVCPRPSHPAAVPSLSPGLRKMTIYPLRLVLQGVGLIPLSMATQGFISELTDAVSDLPPIIVRMAGGTGRKKRPTELEIIPAEKATPEQIPDPLPEPSVKTLREFVLDAPRKLKLPWIELAGAASLTDDEIILLLHAYLEEHPELMEEFEFSAASVT